MLSTYISYKPVLRVACYVCRCWVCGWTGDQIQRSISSDFRQRADQIYHWTPTRRPLCGMYVWPTEYNPNNSRVIYYTVSLSPFLSLSLATRFVVPVFALWWTYILNNPNKPNNVWTQLHWRWNGYYDCTDIEVTWFNHFIFFISFFCRKLLISE